MATWGRADYRQWQQLQKNFEQYAGQIDMDQFCKECCRELAARLLALVKPATPVGKYPRGSSKVGGTLRRGWTGGQNAQPRAYANSLPVTKSGQTYIITITNPVEYASYVEFGHRTRGGNGWVEGRYMLTTSEDRLSRMSQAILEKKLQKKFKEVFNV